MNNHEKIRDIVKPILRSERRETYSPFLPICPDTGQVFQVKIDDVDVDSKKIFYVNPVTNKPAETEIQNGNAKLQWRADWAMRWKALSIHYEMSGKDLIDSVRIAAKYAE